MVELLGKVLNFYNGKAAILSESGQYPVYGSNGIIGFSDKYKYEHSIIIGRVGAYCGSINFERGKYWASDNTIVADAKTGNSVEFLSLLLKALPLNSLAGGSAQPLINQTLLSRIKTWIPECEEQKKIAAILSAYDDLIENNKRRIALLEKMAEEIYREWFVRFRFPGYQTAEFEKGIPKEWCIKSIDKLCLKVTDGCHASPALFESGKFMASVKDMTNYGFNKNTMKTISEKDFESLVKSDCQPKKNDILIAKDGSYLKHVFVWSDNYDVVLLSSIAILRPDLKKVSPLFLSMMLRQPSTKSMMSGYVSGSALPRIILKDFKKMELMIPAHSVMDKFESIISPIYKNIKNLDASNEKLSSLKEMLLPRLISGNLSVENLDIQFPPSMSDGQAVVG